MWSLFDGCLLPILVSASPNKCLVVFSSNSQALPDFPFDSSGELFSLTVRICSVMHQWYVFLSLSFFVMQEFARFRLVPTRLCKKQHTGGHHDLLKTFTTTSSSAPSFIVSFQ
ncbi:hypothetical protein BJ508DRAFT_129680 [Ascobolus immersus RN42]|uniref:Secreted protein n=1 Tax=Ascobolus immersus RN42 TaxID=1160509 RepID=A0A3N4I8K4_ASCIM|nr:hypothetical protein BJ508DRAFT_129680 [Ascobolus immersus RN42]